MLLSTPDLASVPSAEVMAAVRKHMLRESGDGGSLRFGITGADNEEGECFSFCFVCLEASMKS